MPIMKQNERKIETERKIENAFLELVELKGFENVHLVDIAKRANVNRNTVYLRYGTKEDIIAQILDKTFAKRLEKISDEVFKKVKPTKRRLEIITLVINTFKQEQETMDSLSARDLYFLLRRTSVSPSLEELIHTFELLSTEEIGVLTQIKNDSAIENNTYSMCNVTQSVNRLRALATAIEKGIN